ncbi:MAG TPA: flagellar hook-associated protein FlgK [Modestobacter sp.]|nr:flagellar hook-associated protein FlgK [Modestobacter sp.]
MSTFSGLNTATTALWAQQRGLDITGQNIANVNTPGYTRQRAELASMGGNAIPAISAVSSNVGGGVSADSVIRIRDAFLEGRTQVEQGKNAQFTAESDALTQIEQAFREPGTTGIQSMLTDMWNGWSDVVNHPDDLAARGQLLQRTQTLVIGMNTTSAALDKQAEQTRDNLQTLVSDVNASAASIADLNQAIKRATQAGLPANELADKRDALVLTLAGKVGATATPGEDGVVNVVVGGTTLVAGVSSLDLALVPAAGVPGEPRIVTTTGNSTLSVGGTAAGSLTALKTTIPGYRAQLDGVAKQLVGTLNAEHAKGYDLNGQPGRPLLDDGAGSGATAVDPATVTAANIRLRIADPRGIAAADLAPDATGGASLDNDRADAIYQLRLGAGSVDSTYRAVVVNLGVNSAVAARNLDIQSVITSQVESSRESVSGVNLDEEMTNMLSFQHAYSAAARMITAIDEALDVLINKTGLVGR